MKRTIIAVSTPVYSSADKSTITCLVTFEEIGQHPYTAAAHDPYPHGQQLWADLLAEKYGVIAPYVQPTPTADEIKRQARTALVDSDTVAMRCIKAGVAYPEEWKKYDASLRAIASSGKGTMPTQPAFPAGT
jgi:hypothetical protein